MKYVAEVSNRFGWSNSVEYMEGNLISGSNLVRNILHVEHDVKKMKGFHLNVFSTRNVPAQAKNAYSQNIKMIVFLY